MKGIDLTICIKFLTKISLINVTPLNVFFQPKKIFFIKDNKVTAQYVDNVANEIDFDLLSISRYPTTAVKNLERPFSSSDLDIFDFIFIFLLLM